MSVNLIKEDSELFDNLLGQYMMDKNEALKARKVKVLTISIPIAIACMLVIAILNSIIGVVVFMIMFAFIDSAQLIYELIQDDIDFHKQYEYILISNDWELKKVENTIVSSDGTDNKNKYMLKIGDQVVVIKREQYKILKDTNYRSVIMLDLRDTYY